MSLSTVLAWLVIIVAVPMVWYSTWRLWLLRGDAPGSRVLRVMMVLSLALAIIVTTFGVIFLNNEMRPPFLDNEATRLITRSVVLALAVIPATILWWLLGRRAP